jgi:hypothetical protein
VGDWGGKEREKGNSNIIGQREFHMQKNTDRSKGGHSFIFFSFSYLTTGLPSASTQLVSYS